MRMLSIVIIPAGVAFTTPAFAKPSEEMSFKHEGVTYVYSVVEKGAAHFITGRSYPRGGTFALKVEDGSVVGTSNGSRVRFDVADAQGATQKGGAELLTMR